jgi:hypothetical protein
MWRDQLQIGMLARHCHSISELIHLKRYEGHPDAWYVLIYFVQRFSTNAQAMQLLHLFIASATAYVVARYAPFTRIHRALLVFGYFLFLEYATISRAYALGVFCVFGFCAVFRDGLRKNCLLLAVSRSNQCVRCDFGVVFRPRRSGRGYFGALDSAFASPKR